MTKEFMGKIFVLNPYKNKHPGIHYQKDNETFHLMEQLATQGAEANISMQLIQMEGEKVFYKKINDDEFFMIGDNRDNSSDSRFWGSVAYKNIVGSPWFVYFSLSLKIAWKWMQKITLKNAIWCVGNACLKALKA